MRGAGAVVLVALLAFGFLGTVPPARASTVIEVWKTASLAIVDPDDNLTFTIILDNTGTGAARDVWVNDTLPDRVEYVGDDAATGLGTTLLSKSFSGTRVQYWFDDYAPGNRSFRIWTRVKAPATDGAPVLNVVQLDYVTDGGVLVEDVFRQSLSFMRVATLDLQVRAPATVTPSAAYDHVIWYNNTADQSAGSVSLNLTLPPAATFLSVSGDDASWCGNEARWVNCSIPLVPPEGFGPRSLTVRSFLEPTVPLGAVLSANASIFYTADDDGSYFVWSNASASYTVASGTSATLAAASDAEVLLPGGPVGFTAWLNMTGGPAQNAWLNATLPPGTTLADAVPEPSWATAAALGWNFTGRASSVRVDVEVVADGALPSGTALPFAIGAAYTDAAGRRMPEVSAGASATVLTPLPDLTVEIAADAPTVPAGGQAEITVYLNNTGGAAATDVRLLVELPQETRLDAASENYTGAGAGAYRFNFTSLPPGSKSITLTVGVSSLTAEGTALYVNATARYGDPQGRTLRPRNGSASLTAGPPVSTAVPTLFAVGITLAVSLWVLVMYFVVQRVRQGTPRIDEVFLLHRDGLLIRHYARRFRPEMDSDVLSGMLIAVQNFVNESFVGADWERSGGLDEMKFGQYRIAISRGQTAVIAAVVSGPRPEEVHRQMGLALADVERDLGAILASWDGSMDRVAGADRYLQDLLSGKYRRRR